MANGQPLTLERLKRLIPPPAPTTGLALGRLTMASCFLSNAPVGTSAMTMQDDQATLMEQQLFVGAYCRWSTSTGMVNSLPTPPNLRAPLDPSNPAYKPPSTVSTDPRMDLWFAYDADQPPVPVPVVANTAGAQGAYLDAWGSVLGNSRRIGAGGVMETDDVYAIRILSDIARPSTTNAGLSAIVDAALSLSYGTGLSQVVDAFTSSAAPRFNNGLRAASASTTGNPAWGARCSGFAAGNSTLAGCFYVLVPLTRAALNSLAVPSGAGPGAGVGPAWVNKLLSRRKAAGTWCTGVFATDDAGHP